MESRFPSPHNIRISIIPYVSRKIEIMRRSERWENEMDFIHKHRDVFDNELITRGIM